MTHPVVHFEIMGPDPDALEAFYTQLFGWKVQTMPEMNYKMVDTNGGAGINGGITANPENTNGQIFYVETADLQATLDKAETLGGKTMMPVMAIPNGPTIAVFLDRVGNPIGLVGAHEEDVPGPTKGTGAPVGWFEIHGAPFDEQRSFYNELFGWEISKFDGPDFTYGEIKNPRDDYGTGGALSSPSSGFTGITIWGEVADPEKALAKAEKLGAKIDMPATTMPDGLTIGNFIDPQGNRLGVYKPPSA